MIPIDFNNPAAFAPFYTDRVSVSGKIFNREAGTSFPVDCVCPACVMESGLADVDAGSIGISAARSFTISIPKREWMCPEPPRIGLQVEIVGRTYHNRLKVVSVDEDGSDWIFSAESKGGGNG